jgi:hypothetical protein
MSGESSPQAIVVFYKKSVLKFSGSTVEVNA